MTLREALAEAAAHITRRDAETLLAHALNRDRPWILAHIDNLIAPTDLAAFRSLTTRRAAHHPLQHLTGTQEFFGLPLHVTPDVLIPRPETEHLVEAVLHWANSQPTEKLRIADVGTGSGAIAIALAAHLPDARITALDLSPAALAVARANARQLRLDAHIRFLESDLLTALQLELAQHRLDAVISNPPYVPTTDAPTLAPEVRDHEPALALYAGPDGLDIYRRLIPQAFDALRPNGLLALEIGFGQRQPLTDLLTGWHSVRFLNDYAGIPRVALALHP